MVQTQILVVQGPLCGNSSENVPYYREKSPWCAGEKLAKIHPDLPILAFFVPRFFRFPRIFFLRFSLLFCAFLLSFPRISRVLQEENPRSFRGILASFAKKNRHWRVRAGTAFLVLRLGVVLRLLIGSSGKVEVLALGSVHDLDATAIQTLRELSPCMWQCVSYHTLPTGGAPDLPTAFPP